METIPVTTINKLLKAPLIPEGPLTSRKHNCSFCDSSKGYQISKGQYWDLESFDFIRCDTCDLIQMDPMIGDVNMGLGCTAHYLMEQAREGAKNLNRNMIRSFRKGVYFALRLKKLGINPQRVLEMGPGDGFFCRGISYVFPSAKIHVVDIVEEVVKKISAVHGFEGIVGSLEDASVKLPKGSFDLIIARDIIEHVAKPDLVIQNISELLTPQGYFHFITPNGYEDIWSAYCCWKTLNEPCEILLNHVNFFPPIALQEKLEKKKFKAVEYFIYDFKGTRWGRGRKVSPKLAGTPAKSQSAKKTIEQFSQSKNPITGLRYPTERWWVKSSKLLTYIYCFWKEHFKLKVAAPVSVGHEIYGLFQKQ